MNKIQQINNIETKKKDKTLEKILDYIKYGAIIVFAIVIGLMIGKQLWRTLF